MLHGSRSRLYLIENDDNDDDNDDNDDDDNDNDDDDEIREYLIDDDYGKMMIIAAKGSVKKIKNK